MCSLNVVYYPNPLTKFKDTLHPIIIKSLIGGQTKISTNFGRYWVKLISRTIESGFESNWIRQINTDTKHINSCILPRTRFKILCESCSFRFTLNEILFAWKSKQIKHKILRTQTFVRSFGHPFPSHAFCRRIMNG